MRTIESFPHREIRRRLTIRRTALFVRDKGVIIDQIIELLEDVWSARFNRKLQVFSQPRARKFIEKLEKELTGPVPALRMLGVARWYERHWRDKHMFVIDSGEAFYNKFSRLEATMQWHRAEHRPAATVEGIVSGLFNGSAVLADSFRSDILVKTRALRLGDASDAMLADKLGSIYRFAKNVIQASGRGSGIGPLDFLSRYVAWLADQDWIGSATVRVLDAESPAFQRFRRWEAEHHPYGHDPLTGGTR